MPTGTALPVTPAHVLITTRRHGYSHLGTVLDIDVLPPEQARTFLCRRVPDLAPDCAAAIAAELGCLPLALEQAAGYLRGTGLPGADYLRLLRTRAADLYRRGQVPGHRETIATLWDLAFERLTVEHPAALQLLGICVWLAPEAIPLDLFAGHADLLPAPLADDTAPDVQGDVSWLLDRAANYLRTQGQASAARPLLERALAITEAVYGPHHPEVATTPGLLAWVLRDRGGTAGARPVSEQAVAIAEAALGPHHPEVAIDLNTLARILLAQGDVAGAQPLAERALAISSTVYGDQHPRMIEVRTTLAKLQAAQEAAAPDPTPPPDPTPENSPVPPS